MVKRDLEEKAALTPQVRLSIGEIQVGEIQVGKIQDLMSSG